VDQFIKKELAWEHFAAFSTRNKTKVYQVRKSVYRILGNSDNRNRRPKQAALQRLRLMSLDYVLANPNKCFLTTESDKLEYLGALGTTASEYPSRTYTPNLKTSVRPTTRYFIEKFPIFRRGEGAGFTFMCENSVQTFESFLDRYLRLLVSIPEAEFVYVTTNPQILPRVEAVFHVQLASHAASTADLTTFELEFRERQALEAKGFESATTEELKRLRTLRLKNYSNLYPTWQAEGIAGIEKVLGKTLRRRTSAPQFSAYVLPHNYLFL
jgi:hypothetical protein